MPTSVAGFQIPVIKREIRQHWIKILTYWCLSYEAESIWGNCLPGLPDPHALLCLLALSCGPRWDTRVNWPLT